MTVAAAAAAAVVVYLIQKTVTCFMKNLLLDMAR